MDGGDLTNGNFERAHERRDLLAMAERTGGIARPRAGKPVLSLAEFASTLLAVVLWTRASCELPKSSGDNGDFPGRLSPETASEPLQPLVPQTGHLARGREVNTFLLAEEPGTCYIRCPVPGGSA
jgi:hypothetical protein